MSIEAIGSQQVLLNTMNQMRNEAGIAPADQLAHNDVNFSSLITTALNRVNYAQHTAGAMMTAIETGQSDDLVGTMVASQKASLSFSALVQVRNKLVAAFDDIMRMPI